MDIPNGWYGEALPDGEWAVSIPTTSSIQTHLGTWTERVAEGKLPQVAHFVRCTAAGGFKVACQGGNSGNYLIVPPGASWELLGPSYGVSPVAFDLAGNPVQNQLSYGSQGIRWIDTEVHTGDQTYIHPTIPSLYEYTTHGDVTVGQGGNGGAIVIHNNTRRVLEPGNTTFIRYNRSGDKHAFAIVKPGYAVLKWLTTAELDALPLDHSLDTIPAPPASPPPPPQEPPVSFEAPNQYNLVAAVMAEHPEINTRDEIKRERILPLILRKLGGFPWGRKSRNPAGTDLNTDAITYRRQDNLFEIYDVINGSTGGAAWDAYGPFKDGENGYFVTQPTSEPQPDPTPVPIPDPVPDIDISPLLEALESLRARVEALETAPAPPAPIHYQLKVNQGKILGAPYVKTVELEIVS